jgi:hypothetical protein
MFKEELKKPKYYLHLLIIVVIVLSILQYFLGEQILTIKNIIYSIPLLFLGDTIAHTILGLN